jgi:hypothetical protein
MSKAVKIKIHKTMVKLVAVYGSETRHNEKTEYMGEENIKQDMWTSCRTKKMENMK